MENISRVDLDRIALLLETHVSTEDSIVLADKLRNADIIPKLYQAAYIESINKILEGVDTAEQLKEKLGHHFDYGLILARDGKAIEAVKAIADKAHDRQNDICDFNDTTLPHFSIGRCDNIDGDHYETIHDQIDELLTPKEFEVFEKIRDKEGWQEACEKFQDKLNPDNQKLELFLEWGSDESKMAKNSGFYCCKKCAERINEDSEGGISCDMANV